ncbi:MAG: hypothetical protein K2I14_08640 [Eubacterium sp.]|nr:hypothetical protein [Eubacterium sp.]
MNVNECKEAFLNQLNKFNIVYHVISDEQGELIVIEESLSKVTNVDVTQYIIRFLQIDERVYLCLNVGPIYKVIDNNSISNALIGINNVNMEVYDEKFFIQGNFIRCTVNMDLMNSMHTLNTFLAVHDKISDSSFINKLIGA